MPGYAGAQLGAQEDARDERRNDIGHNIAVIGVDHGAGHGGKAQQQAAGGDGGLDGYFHQQVQDGHVDNAASHAQQAGYDPAEKPDRHAGRGTVCLVADLLFNGRIVVIGVQPGMRRMLLLVWVPAWFEFLHTLPFGFPGDERITNVNHKRPEYEAEHRRGKFGGQQGPGHRPGDHGGGHQQSQLEIGHVVVDIYAGGRAGIDDDRYQAAADGVLHGYAHPQCQYGHHHDAAAHAQHRAQRPCHQSCTGQRPYIYVRHD